MACHFLRLLVIGMAGWEICALRTDTKHQTTMVAKRNEIVVAGSNAKAFVDQAASAMEPAKSLNAEAILTTGVGLATSMISAFSEDPPDFEYGFMSLNLQGWKLLKLIVPKERQKSREFKRASRAWKAAFADASEIIEELFDSWNQGDMYAIAQSILRIADTAFKTAAAAVSRDGDLFLAFNGFVQKVGDLSINFWTSMDSLERSSSFVQVSTNTDLTSVTDSKRLTMLLTTGVGIVTTLLSAFNEDPPDFELAFDSIALQGWKIVKIIVPVGNQQTDKFKNAHEAWKIAFTEASGIADGIVQGNVARSLIQALDTALKAAGHLADPSLEEILDHIRRLVVGIGEAWIELSHQLNQLA